MKAIRPFVIVLFLSGACLFLVSCGTTDCSGPDGIIVRPETASADHAAVAPGNQVQFTATWTPTPKGCIRAQVMPVVRWTTSDAANTSINASGLATCINSTSQPATITATLENGSATARATLTCR